MLPLSTMLAKATYSSPLGMSTSQTPTTSYHSGPSQKAIFTTHQDGMSFTSPTESEFSEAQDGLEAVRSWDEKQVITWLHSIKCGQYESLFKANNFNGNNLIECDQKILQEMGIKKVGDRVRIFVAIKQLRNKSVANRKQKNIDQLAALESAYTPASSQSSRPSMGRQPTLNNRRFSHTADNAHGYKPPSRPGSPLRAQRYVASPMESARKEQGQGYFSHNSSGGSGATRKDRKSTL